MADNYVEPSASGLAWDDPNRVFEGGTPYTQGFTQQQLQAMWAKSAADPTLQAFNNQGSEALDQSGGARAANSRWVMDGDDNRENDFYLTQGPDGQISVEPIMRHGWNAEFATFALPIITAGAAAAYGAAGGAAAGAGASASEAGAAGAGAYSGAGATLSAAEVGGGLAPGVTEAMLAQFPAMNVGGAAAAGGAAGALAGAGGGSAVPTLSAAEVGGGLAPGVSEGMLSQFPTMNVAGAGAAGSAAGEAAYGWNPEGYTGGTPSLAGGGFGGAGNMGSTSTGFLGMGTGDWLQLGGSLLNGYLGQRAADKAAEAQIGATREGNALLKYMYDQTRADNMPALQARNNGLGGYQNLLKNPGSITSEPGYQFGLDQGTKAIGSQAAAHGGYYSGATLKALDKFGQDYGGTKLDQSLNRFGNLAGLGQVGSNTIAQAGNSYANNASQNLIGAGNARGAASMAGSNAWQNALNSYLGYQQYKNQFGG